MHQVHSDAPDNLNRHKMISIQKKLNSFPYLSNHKNIVHELLLHQPLINQLISVLFQSYLSVLPCMTDKSDRQN